MNPSSTAALLALGFAILPRPASAAAAAPDKLQFNRDIRPVLSENCFQCHGPDKNKRKANLRLDVRADALQPAKSGETAIVPGDTAKSELVARIFSREEDDQMPPEDSHKSLSDSQKALLKRWIAEGAEYQAPWAFITPQRPALPKLGNAWWPKNPIDSFIGATLEERGLSASPEAARELLLRRVSFALTGLPPSAAASAAFLADTAPDAYERLVDALLATPQYGESMAKHWLDAARYGDTHGLHLDNERSMWPYRDWVVRAFNDNLSFDQFTVWQLGGDLLPNPTRDQLIASGFNRCNVTTGEGGSINEEVLFRYALDRTETAVSNWMGLTSGCAACHDHKFDPISQKDFYSLYAFFNSAADPAMDGNDKFTPPILKLHTPEDEKALAEFNRQAGINAVAIQDALTKVSYQDPASLTPPPPVQTIETVWFDDEFPEGAKAQTAGAAVTWAAEVGGAPVPSGKRAIQRTGKGIVQDFFEGAKSRFAVPSTGKIYASVWIDPANPPKAIMLQWHTDGGWKHRANWGDKDAITFGAPGTPEKLQIGDLPKPGEWTRLEVDVAALKLPAGTTFDGLAFTQFDGTVFWDKSGVVFEKNDAADPALSLAAWDKANTGKDPGDKTPKEIRDILRSVKPEARTPAQAGKLRDYFLSEICPSTQPAFAPFKSALATIETNRKALEAKVPATLIMRELDQKREAHIMLRGQYDKPGEVVQPAVPAIFTQIKSEGRANRLDLARWLMTPENPLPSRVMVNRLWQQFYGTGLVKTAGDFGAQGEPPSHPELLDWLAVEFRESGWDIKKLVRLLVTSAAYRQDSRVTPKLLEADPENRLLARGPRFRLDAEEIRDNALAVSGLLDGTVGGPPVKPYQPDNIWEPLGFVGSNTREYKRDNGQALYRRSLYTFWKRNAPAPAMTTFDAPSRDSTCVRRERSNTPLQALNLMNDIQQFEAARALGQRMLAEAGPTPEERIAFGFQIVAARRPLPAERDVLKETFTAQLGRFAIHPEAAQKTIAFGESKPRADLNPNELAAYTMVASVLLNMDETLNKN